MTSFLKIFSFLDSQNLSFFYSYVWWTLVIWTFFCDRVVECFSGGDKMERGRCHRQIAFHLESPAENVFSSKYPRVQEDTVLPKSNQKISKVPGKYWSLGILKCTKVLVGWFLSWKSKVWSSRFQIIFSIIDENHNFNT